MSFSSVITKAKRDTRDYLYFCLEEAIKERNWQEVSDLRVRLKTMALEASMGFMVRSRFKQNVEEEKASLFHSNRKKKNAQKNNHEHLKINRIIENDKAKIEKEIIDFFFPLFNGYHGPNGINTGKTFVQDRTLLDDFLAPLGKLSADARENLEAPLSMKELEEIVKELPNNKSPGLDGLPFEFYKENFHLIQEDLKKMIDCILERIRLTNSQSCGATRLLSKVTGVPAADELRPITLLNSDYKIITKIFVKRLLPYLPQIILSGQLCSVDGRNILFGASNLISSLHYITKMNIPAALLSFDQWKAYDRVFIPFLLQVMKAMNFGDLFIQWIEMLHANNMTKFILNSLTDPIKLLFSVRQGDPITMLLYLIFVEPLLMRIRSKVKGVQIANIKAIDEDYVDDVNILVDTDQDFHVIDGIFEEFEAVSGAILNRSHKSKVLGLGQWANRTNWPLPWIKNVNELKIFGFQLKKSYEETLEANWNHTVPKFKGCLTSWNNRILDTFRKRIDVIHIFGTSRLWYKCQVLPLPRKFRNLIESAITQFLWRGYLERLEINEIKNEASQGGLGLICVFSKANSLFLKSTCRMLVTPNTSYYQHIQYWLGLDLREYFPNMANGPHSELIPPYFQNMKDLLIEGLKHETIKANKLKFVSSKFLYQEFTTTFPPPKVIYKYDLNWNLVWKRLNNPVHDTAARDILFRMIHNIIPNRQRLFKLNQCLDPFCLEEQIVRNGEVVGGQEEDNEHLFTSCLRTREPWLWLRRRILEFLPDTSHNLSNWEIIHLTFPEYIHESTVLWLISSYCDIIWNDLVKRGLKINTRKIVSKLQERYRIHLCSNRVQLSFIDFSYA